MSKRQLPSGIEVRIREDLSSGIRIGDTLNIEPIITKSGHRVSMADMGTRGFAKIDAGTPLEEIISWTGITDNGDTYTLTGVVWGINFHNTEGNFSDNMKRHISGAKFSINTDMHYVSDQFVNKDDFDVKDNTMGWGDGTKNKDKVLEARNGEVNKPFIVYNETENKWLVSNDGINTYDIVAGGGGLSAGYGTRLNDGKIDLELSDFVDDEAITIISNKLGLKVKGGTGLIKDGDGLWVDSIDTNNLSLNNNKNKVLRADGEGRFPSGDGMAIDSDNLNKNLASIQGRSVYFSKITGDFFIIAGGGGGGRSRITSPQAGSGGAGELLVRENVDLLSGEIKIGAGGLGGASQYGSNGGNGGDSSYGNIKVKGGGGGAIYTSGFSPGKTGGSSGGNNDINSGSNVVEPTKYNLDGLGHSNGGYLDGGGAGGPATGRYKPGPGVNVWGLGEIGKGGTGGVGGGGYRGDNNGAGGAGGAGRCVIRYKTANYSNLTITGGTKSTSGIYTYHTFTGNGNFLIDTGLDGLIQNLINNQNYAGFKLNFDNNSYDIKLKINSIDNLVNDIQQAIRNKTGNNEWVVEYLNNKFKITAPRANDKTQLDILSPTESGVVDISGRGGEDYLGFGSGQVAVYEANNKYKVVKLDADGEIPAPLIKGEAMASDIIRIKSETEREISHTSYIKIKEIEYNGPPGIIKVSFAMKSYSSSYNIYGRVYVNNIAKGTEKTRKESSYDTFSDEIFVNNGDLISLYNKIETSGYNGYIKDFSLSYSIMLKTEVEDKIINN